MADLVVTNFFTFCLFGSSLFLFYFWTLTLPSRVFVVGFYFSIALWIYPHHPFLACIFYWEIWCYSYGGSLVCYKLFSLAAFRFFPLFLTFDILITVSLSVHLFGFFLSGTSWLAKSGCLFPSLGLVNFQPLFLQISFLSHFLFLFLESL